METRHTDADIASKFNVLHGVGDGEEGVSRCSRDTNEAGFTQKTDQLHDYLNQ